MDLSALDDFGAFLAEWSVKLMVQSPFHNHPNTKPVDPRSPEPIPRKKLLPKTKIGDRPTEAELKKTKPIAPSVYKFALTQGPEIFYDGESQALLFEFWSSVSLKRGTLRKETNFLKRSNAFLVPTFDYGYTVGGFQTNDDVLEVDDESDDEERELEDARIQAQQRENSRRLAVLEHVNTCVEQALDACEKAAFLWLKGQGCAGHVVYITSQLNAAVDQINTENKNVKAVADVDSDADANANAEDEDEGLDVELDTAPCFPSKDLVKEVGNKPAEPKPRPQFTPQFTPQLTSQSKPQFELRPKAELESKRGAAAVVEESLHKPPVTKVGKRPRSLTPSSPTLRPPRKRRRSQDS
jgi:hypothetical protein